MLQDTITQIKMSGSLIGIIGLKTIMGGMTGSH